MIKTIFILIFISSTWALTLISSTANAGLILEVDLSVENTIILTATSNVSLIDSSGDDEIGFYLADFFMKSNNLVYGTLLSGNLTSANNLSDLSPSLYQAYHLDNYENPVDTGLNVWSFTDDATSSFTANQVAFSGQARWAVNAASYFDALNGSRQGNIYAGVDDITGISAANILGTWQRNDASMSVPEPTTLAIFSLGMLGLVSRRMIKKT